MKGESVEKAVTPMKKTNTINNPVTCHYRIYPKRRDETRLYIKEVTYEISLWLAIMWADELD